MGFGDVGVSSRKVAPVGVEKPAYAGVLFAAAHGVKQLLQHRDNRHDWFSALRAEI